jgi:transposase
MDVHQQTVVVCVLPAVGSEGKLIRKVYGTFRNELIRMRVWLKQLKVTEIAMESTGVYWRPIWNVLEEQGFQRLLLVNPVQVKALQGRKSDGRDCQRIAEFLQDQRLDGSFIPPPEIRQLRLMLRHRVALLEQRNQVHNQIRDLLETVGIKLSSVMTDLMGASGRRILEALIAGEDSPEVLSWKVHGRLRKKGNQVRESLKGYCNEFHRTMLQSYYEHYQFLTQQIAWLEVKVEEQMQPHAALIALLVTIPGVDRIVAWTLVAELGTDASVFPDGAHCASWAGVVPGEDESAGKQRSRRCRKGNRTLRRILTQAAWAASHCKHGYLRALFYRIKARRGWGKAILAVGHKILLIAYGIIKDRVPYRDLGDDYFDKLNPARTVKRLVHRLERMGLEVQVSEVRSAASTPSL